MGPIPYGIALGDLNNDGRGDMVAELINTGQITVFLNTGPNRCTGPYCPVGPGFAEASYAAGGALPSLALGDLNSDGRPDIAVTSVGSACSGPFCPPPSPTGLEVLLNNGDGTFGAAGNLAPGTRPADVALGDLNGDGKNDLVVVNPDTDTVSVLFSNDDASVTVPTEIFNAPVDFTAGDGPSSVAIGDVNGDGRLDLAVANMGSNNVSDLLRLRLGVP